MEPNLSITETARELFGSPRRRALAIAAVAVAVLVYLVALPVDVLEVDAAQYAWMAREMVQKGAWLQVLCRGHAYLDKPPLLFWLTASTYALVGASSVASRIPQLLVLALGVVSTWGLGRRLYGPAVGLAAAFMLLVTQAFFSMGMDVRTDGMLTGMVAFALWQLVEYDRTEKMRNLVLGSVGVGLAMLAKGPLGLMVPVLGFGADTLIRRDWKRLFRWQWLLVPVIAAGVLVPMLVGLYQQHGWEGPKFFFWTQSFGRITGENEFKNETSVFYFVHTAAWAFLPWTVLFFASLIRQARRAFDSFRGRAPEVELITFGAVVLTLAGLSASQYKLPHYCFVVAPPAMVLCAKLFLDVFDEDAPARWRKLVERVQWGLLVLLATATGVVVFWLFPMSRPLVGGGLVLVGVGLVVSAFFTSEARARYLLVSAFAMCAVNLVINAHLFPVLMQYQSTSFAGRELAAREADPGTVFQLHRGRGYALDFYWGHSAPTLASAEEILEQARQRDIWVLASADWKPRLEAAGMQPRVVKSYPDFPVSRLNKKFLDPRTREKALRTRLLLRVPRVE